MTYSVKEIFKTLQGEGAQTGRVAVFCRFAGCNLWSGREVDRTTSVCTFCDTDFVGTNGRNGGTFAFASELADAICQEWGNDIEHRFVVFTGGEPLLQLDAKLLDEMHSRHFNVAVETNGTIEPPDGIDWLCVSPKTGTKLAVRNGQELKLVFPQQTVDPKNFEDLGFEHFWLQPMDNRNKEANTAEIIAFCLKHPRWRLSMQTHKLIGIP